MATNKIPLDYDLYQNNVRDSVMNGKWYPRAVRNTTLDLDGLTDHIASHGSIYTPDVVQGVLKKFTSCMVELVSQGNGVKLNGLGTFYPTLEAEGAESPVDYNLAKCLKGVHLRFLPDDSDRAALTSRSFMKKVAMKLHMIFDKDGVPKKVVDGELVEYGKDEEPGGNGD